MTPDACINTLRRMLDQTGEIVTIRRYTGAGTNRPRYDCEVRARMMEFAPQDLVGNIVQGDRKLIVLAQDLIDRQFPLPLRVGQNEKVVVRGKELQIKAVDDNTRRVAGVLIGYEIVVTG